MTNVERIQSVDELAEWLLDITETAVTFYSHYGVRRIDAEKFEVHGYCPELTSKGTAQQVASYMWRHN